MIIISMLAIYMAYTINDALKADTDPFVEVELPEGVVLSKELELIKVSGDTLFIRFKHNF